MDMHSNRALRKSITWPNLTGFYPGNCATAAITVDYSLALFVVSLGNKTLLPNFVTSSCIRKRYVE